MRFDNNHDANLYLSSSVVKHNGRPVYIVKVSAMIADCHCIATSERFEAPVEELDLTPFRLGYVFDEDTNKPFYIERLPRRRWRQGLTSDNVRAKNVKRFHLSVTGGTLLNTLLAEKYDSVGTAFKTAKLKHTEYPFHSRFSIDHSGIVRFKTQVIGSWDKNGFDLLRPFSYLKEMLEELK